MSENNMSVETNFPAEIAPDAALGTQEAESLESVMNEPPATETQAAEEQPPAKEPGWIKGRVDKAVAKAEQRIRAEYEAKLAPLYESIYDRQAEELVAAGEFKSLDRAKEYVRMKNNVPVETAPAQAEQPARDANGRFAPKQEQTSDPVAQAKADLLFAQAKKIKGAQGLDVMSLFNTDQDVRSRVLSGEWDFYDVADAMRGQAPAASPVPVRSANGGAPTGFDISRMTPEQFQRLQQNLASGHRYDLTK